MRQLTDISEYNAIVEMYHQKGGFSNDYIQQQATNLIADNLLYADTYDRNAFLFVKRDAGIRVYYYINDIDEKADFSTYKDMVVEILFRGELPQIEMEYLTECGFSINLVRDLYGGMYQELASNCQFIPEVKVEVANTLEDVSSACLLFNESFDRLSGDFISDREFQDMLNSQSILIAKNAEDEFLGAIHFGKQGTVVVLKHLAVMKNARGCGVGKALVDSYIQRNKETDKTRYQLWVQRRNEAAVNMYKKIGFKYLNKSTISLIK